MVESGIHGCTYHLCPITDPNPPSNCLNLRNLTVDDFVTDVVSAVQFLQREWGNVIDPNAISLVGHSEGCSVAPYAASRVRVKSIVQLMGIGVPIDIVLTNQAKNGVVSFGAGASICQKTNGSSNVCAIAYVGITAE